MKLRTREWSSLSDAERSEVLRRPATSQDASIRTGASKIVERVRVGGDAAVLDLAQQFDQVAPEPLELGRDEVEAAQKALTARQIAAIDAAIANVRSFHEAQISAPLRVETVPGVVCERLAHAIDSVGLYVPAGTAPLPSTAIMLAVPAAIANCPTRILCTPPRPDASADPAVVVAATRAGVERIFKIGGAQAIAAMAYGTESVPKVAKIFGPGNAWVTAAKSVVAADPLGAAIDMPAGPSEVLVIGDDSANPEFVAADLLSQAEHGCDSQVLFITTSTTSAAAVVVALEQQLAGLARAEIATEALSHSRVIIAPDIATAIEISNRYAPEHLILQFADARKAVAQVRNAGSVFVGPWTPESVGDYSSGTNHVLPTYGFANTWSGLGVDQFQRYMTVQELTRDGLASLSATVTELAALEGLDAHAAAVTRRLGATQ